MRYKGIVWADGPHGTSRRPQGAGPFTPLLSLSRFPYLCAEVVEADQHVGAAALGGDVQRAHQHVQLGPQGVAQPEDRQLLLWLLSLLGRVCGWVEDPYICTYLLTCPRDTTDGRTTVTRNLPINHARTHLGDDLRPIHVPQEGQCPRVRPAHLARGRRVVKGAEGQGGRHDAVPLCVWMDGSHHTVACMVGVVCTCWLLAPGRAAESV